MGAASIELLLRTEQGQRPLRAEVFMSLGDSLSA